MKSVSLANRRKMVVSVAYQPELRGTMRPPVIYQRRMRRKAVPSTLWGRFGHLQEVLPSEPAKDGSVSGLPAGATGNDKSTSSTPAGDTEKGGATDTLKTSRVSGESVSKHRARVVSIGHDDGDSSASPSFHA